MSMIVVIVVRVVSVVLGSLDFTFLWDADYCVEEPHSIQVFQILSYFALHLSRFIDLVVMEGLGLGLVLVYTTQPEQSIHCWAVIIDKNLN